MNTPSAEIQAFLEASLNAAAPVGCTPEDKDVLVSTVSAGIQAGKNWKDILNSLHGTNGHVAAQWKDYYLEHKELIDSLVLARNHPVPTLPVPSTSIQTPVRGAKKPRFPSPSTVSSSDSDELPEFFTPKASPAKVWQPRSLGNGVPFRDADLHMMAGYIASMDNWASLNQESRWNALSKTATPFRSAKAWQIHYRKRKDTIDRLVGQVLNSRQSPTSVPADSTWGPTQRYPGDHQLEGSSYETGSTSSSETLSDVPSDSD